MEKTSNFGAQKQTQTNPNKANPTPILRPLWHPKAKTNPNKPKTKPIEPTRVDLKKTRIS
jgi:hypothetical protein